MPKASLAPKDAVEVSLGIQEGVVEVIGALTRVHQYPPNKKTGVQGDPFPCVQIKVRRCSKDGTPLPDADEILEELGVGKLEKFHPGKAASAADADPEDLGTEVDTEGNCIWTEDGSKLNKQSKWVEFADSLEQKGFRADVLGNGFMPDLVGLVVEVHTETKPKLPGSTSDKDRQLLKAVRIIKYPYEKGKAKAAAAGAGSKASAASSEEGEALALKTLVEIVTEYGAKAEDERTIERKKLNTAVQARLMRNKIPVVKHKGVVDLVKDDAWLEKVCVEDDASPVFGKISHDADAGTVTFAEKE